ncbi:DNA primase [Mesomycoplasma neurolyticum]|uniref:DNA primase n=1 Tax=Mesomycoplasma neurolyticum TaxID=2120 RepID=A0A449A6K6_9BACT|nr:DNA primase [Mesomycoplasma neurolyticum]VEU59891.1 DNA primase [Mesomycoplasma neurolyticum]
MKINQDKNKNNIFNFSIVDVAQEFFKLIKQGSNFKVICPFHGDKNASLIISPSKNIWKCFGCNKGGNAIELVKEYQKIDTKQAIEWLTNKFHIISLKKHQFKKPENDFQTNEKEIINVNSLATILFKVNLLSEINENILLKTFLNKRKLNNNIIQKFDIGYNSNNAKFKNFLINVKKIPKDILINSSLLTENENSFFINRIIFPIKNEFNEIVGFAGRTLDNNSNFPKYLNSKENSVFNKNKILLNWFNAKNNEEIILTEGYMDVLAFERNQIYNSVALMGINLSNHHIKILKNKQITLALDSDEAGKQATYEIIKKLFKNNFQNIYVIDFLNFKDADEFSMDNDLKNAYQKKLHYLNWLNLNHYKTDDLKSKKTINYANEKSISISAKLKYIQK